MSENKLDYERGIQQGKFEKEMELAPERTNLRNENLKLRNNWNELKKFVEAKVKHWEEEEKKWIELGFMKFGGEANNKLIFKIVLNKMQELEGNNE